MRKFKLFVLMVVFALSAIAPRLVFADDISVKLETDDRKPDEKKDAQDQALAELSGTDQSTQSSTSKTGVADEMPPASASKPSITTAAPAVSSVHQAEPAPAAVQPAPEPVQTQKETPVEEKKSDTPEADSISAPAVSAEASAIQNTLNSVPAKPAAEPVKAKDVTPPQEEKSEEPANDETEGGGKVSKKGAVLEDAAKSGKLMVADFDTGDKPNNLGGDFGGWDKDPNDDSQSCKVSYASDDATGNSEGYALRLDYDVDSPSPAYNGFWMKLENLNATPYDTLTFYVRGISKKFTKRLKVELKTADHRSAVYFVSDITGEWKKMEIPLKRFKGIRDWSIMTEMVLVFDDVNTAPKKGTLLVDQVMLERHENGMPTMHPSASAPRAQPAELHSSSAVSPQPKP